MPTKREAELLGIATAQHKEIGQLQSELIDGASLEAKLANLLKSYQRDHDQLDPWGHCDCRKCKLVDELMRPA